jgi:hypothetical protein
LTVYTDFGKMHWHCCRPVPQLRCTDINADRCHSWDARTLMPTGATVEMHGH